MVFHHVRRVSDAPMLLLGNLRHQSTQLACQLGARAACKVAGEG